MYLSHGQTKPWLPTIFAGAGILAMGAVAQMYRRYQRDMKEIRSSVLDKLPSKIFQPSSGTAIEYMDRGSQEVKDNGVDKNTPCLVLHPSGGGCDQGLLLGKLLLPTNCRIIAPSRSGYLKSGLFSSTTSGNAFGEFLDSQVEGIMELLDHLDLRKVTILAFSAASILAMELARRYPARFEKLVLVSPIIPHDTDGKKEALPDPPQWVLKLAFGNDFVKWMAVRLFADAALKSMFGAKPENTKYKSELTAIADAFLPAEERYPGFLKDFEATMKHRLTLEQLKKITAPILFMASETDVQSKLEFHRLPKEMQAQTTEIIRPDGPHMLLDNVSGTKEAIQDFLTPNVERK